MFRAIKKHRIVAYCSECGKEMIRVYEEDAMVGYECVNSSCSVKGITQM